MQGLQLAGARGMQGLERRAGLRGVLAQGRHLLLGLASQGRQGLPLDQELLAGVLHEFPRGAE